jgi:hypothetical protein
VIGRRGATGRRLPEREQLTDSFAANEALLLMNLLSANLLEHCRSQDLEPRPASVSCSLASGVLGSGVIIL